MGHLRPCDAASFIKLGNLPGGHKIIAAVIQAAVLKGNPRLLQKSLNLLAHAAFVAAVLHHSQASGFPERPDQHFFIKGCQVVELDDFALNSPLPEQPLSLQHLIDHDAIGHQSDVASLLKHRLGTVKGVLLKLLLTALGIADIFSRIQPKRFTMSVIGFLLTFALYGVIVDLSSVLMMTTEISLKSVMTIYLAGVPFNLVFGACTFIFLLLFGEAFIKKINRITTKYGILEKS